MFSPEFLAVGSGSNRYRIGNSLRFRASNSANLTRTPSSATNRRTWTWSGWIKRGTLGTQQFLFEAATDVSNRTSIILGNSLSDSITVFANGTATISVETNALLRDPSAWYHVVVAMDTTQGTAANRVRVYVNGVEITSFATATYPSLNADTQANLNVLHRLGCRATSTSTFFDGLMSNVTFVDGQSLTPSSFGQTDPATGQWVPRAYTGTYGANGFFLEFKDAASTVTIGNSSTGSNNWTTSGISVTAGVTFDQSLDTPTNNFATLNPLDNPGGNGNLSNANLQAATLTGDGHYRATVAMPSGSFYAEAQLTVLSGSAAFVGIVDQSFAITGYPSLTPLGYTYSSAALRWNNSVSVAYGATWTISDIIGIAFNATSGTIEFFKNGVSQGVAYTGIPAGNWMFCCFDGSGAQSGTFIWNFGQRPFAYTPPTGFLALNTANLPTPAIPRGDAQFQAVLRTGTGATASITSLAFQPDLVWIKSRSNGTNHNLFDSLRGVNNGLVSNSINAEYADAASLTAFGTSGYTLGADGGSRGVNINTNTYVDWAWRRGVTPGFDIVTYTGNATNRTISHALGAVPHMIAVKGRSNTFDWSVYHRNASSPNPQNGAVFLSLTDAFTANIAYWNNTAPTSSVFSLGTGGSVNANTATYVAYLWTSTPGFSLFGSYTGNGSADGPFVWCGFKPRWIMAKRADSTENWYIYDTVRNTFNSVDLGLLPNLTIVETGYAPIDVTAGGFKVRGSGTSWNASGGTYIFAAFAETPFKFATGR